MLYDHKREPLHIVGKLGGYQSRVCSKRPVATKKWTGNDDIFSTLWLSTPLKFEGFFPHKSMEWFALAARCQSSIWFGGLATSPERFQPSVRLRSQEARWPLIAPKKGRWSHQVSSQPHLWLPSFVSSNVGGKSRQNGPFHGKILYISYIVYKLLMFHAMSHYQRLNLVLVGLWADIRLEMHTEHLCHTCFLWQYVPM